MNGPTGLMSPFTGIDSMARVRWKDAARGAARARVRARVVAATTVCLALLMLVSIARGQEAPRPPRPLTAELRLQHHQMRSDAPAQVTVTLTSNRAALFQGVLELRLNDGVEQAMQYHSDPLAITRGSQTYRFTIPPVSAENFQTAPRAHLRFIELDDNGGVIDIVDFARLDLIAWPDVARVFQIAVCDTQPEVMGMSSQSRIVAANLRIDPFVPTRDNRRSPISTGVVHLPLADVGVSPLSFTRHDLVVIDGEAFSRLSVRQLNALSAWVQAGGSVCIAATASASDHHLTFLNTLIDEPASKSFNGTRTIFTHNDDGTVAAVHEDATRRAWSLHHAGLGRAMIIVDRAALADRDRLPEDANRQWRRAAGFLWRLRPEHVERIADNQPLEVQTIRHYNPYEYPEDSYLHYRRDPLPTGDQLVGNLLPDNIRVIPFATLVWILIGLTIVIGPVDYYFLGLLRQRKLTWVTFPTMTIAFTIITVWITNDYMGRSDHRDALRIVDVGRGGTVLRENTFEVIFAASSKTIEQTCEDTIFVPMFARQFATNRGDDLQNMETGTAYYSGRVTNDYRYQGRVRQWQPQLNRFFTIPTDREPIVALALDDADPSQWRTEAGRNELRQKMVQADSTLAYILLMNRHKTYELLGRDLIYHRYLHRNTYVYPDYNYLVPGVYGPDDMEIRTFLKDVSRRLNYGWFSIVSQIAPTGGPNFEDLSILDSSDPNQWLLVILKPDADGEGVVMYRRLFRE